MKVNIQIKGNPETLTPGLHGCHIHEKGVGMLEAITNRITLSEGPLSILSAAGTSLMIHGHTDKCVSGPTKSGVSGGPRLACGVIRKIA